MNFYVLMEALYRRYGEPAQEPSLRTEPAQEVALFKSDPSIAFPGSELTSLIRNDAGQFTLTTKFLGFSGSQSPLPGYYLDRMARESAQNEEGLAAFLDLFSHRWTQFAYHAWRKYRYYICFRNGGTDGFRNACTHWLGWAIKACATNLPSTTAKCWPTREYWQRRAARLTWYATWSLTVLIYRMSSLITGSCVKYRSICHSRTGCVRYPGMPQRHQLADTVVNGFSTDPLQALRAESLTTAGDLLSGGGIRLFSVRSCKR
jgi:hypothetical protein